MHRRGGCAPGWLRASRPRLVAHIISGKRITTLFMLKTKMRVPNMTMQQRLGSQEATPRNSLGQLFSSLGRGDRRGRHKPHANRRWHPEMTCLEDRVVLSVPPGAIGFTPAQVATAYGINAISLAVDHRSVIGNGAGQTIAIIDAGDDPTIAHDLHAFDQNFGLPDPPSFTVVNQNGLRFTPGAPPPGLHPTNSKNGESGETSLDVEWAHAVAPEASILLVECNSLDIGPKTTPATSNAAIGIRTAANWPGVSVVSMSFGGKEFPTESNFDSVFTTPPGHTPVTFLAATGDSFTDTTTPTPPPTNAALYPAVSPNVVAVGGTTLSLNPNNSWKGEVAWNQHDYTNPKSASASQGGFSLYEPLPSYQQGLQPFGAMNVHNTRMVPDVSILSGTDKTNPGTAIPANSSNPAFGSGVAIYDSWQDGKAGAAATPWLVHLMGTGDSLGPPTTGALIAIADQLRQSVGEAPLSSSQTLNTLYSLPGEAFHDIVAGGNIAQPQPYFAGPGYDLVTGRGSPVANVLVPALAGAPMIASLQREGIHQQTTIDLSFVGAGPGTGPAPRQLQAAGGGPLWAVQPPDPPAFSDLQRGDPDGGARAEPAVPESHVRAAGQGHAAAWAEEPARHLPGRRQPEGDLQWVHPFPSQPDLTPGQAPHTHQPRLRGVRPHASWWAG